MLGQGSVSPPDAWPNSIARLVRRCTRASQSWPPERAAQRSCHHPRVDSFCVPFCDSSTPTQVSNANRHPPPSSFLLHRQLQPFYWINLPRNTFLKPARTIPVKFPRVWARSTKKARLNSDWEISSSSSVLDYAAPSRLTPLKILFAAHIISIFHFFCLLWMCFSYRAFSFSQGNVFRGRSSSSHSQNIWNFRCTIPRSNKQSLFSCLEMRLNVSLP